jgi:hypothetical protein
MAVPHGDHVTVVAPRRPNHHDHPLSDVACGDVTHLTIVETVIDLDRIGSVEEFLCINRKIEPAMLQRPLPLDRIERRRHEPPATLQSPH